jgi:hypothetical protein
MDIRKELKKLVFDELSRIQKFAIQKIEIDPRNKTWESYNKIITERLEDLEEKEVLE